jgi:hypothetical protein
MAKKAGTISKNSSAIETNITGRWRRNSLVRPCRDSFARHSVKTLDISTAVITIAPLMSFTLHAGGGGILRIAKKKRGELER